jgi:hypothetical protein
MQSRSAAEKLKTLCGVRLWFARIVMAYAFAINAFLAWLYIVEPQKHIGIFGVTISGTPESLNFLRAGPGAMFAGLALGALQPDCSERRRWRRRLVDRRLQRRWYSEQHRPRLASGALQPSQLRHQRGARTRHSRAATVRRTRLCRRSPGSQATRTCRGSVDGTTTRHMPSLQLLSRDATMAAVRLPQRR